MEMREFLPGQGVKDVYVLPYKKEIWGLVRTLGRLWWAGKNVEKQGGKMNDVEECQKMA